ncbi:MAG: membrane protein insertase YidC [bacterium]
MEKNTLIAVFLSFLFIFGWYMLTAPQRRAVQEKAGVNAPADKSQEIVSQAVAEKKTEIASEKVKKGSTKNQSFANHNVKTGMVEVIFSEDGGSIKNYLIKERDKFVDLIPESSSEGNGLFLATLPNQLFVKESQKDVTVDGKSYEAISFVNTSNKSNIDIRKIYYISKEGFLHKLKFEFINKSNSAELLDNFNFYVGKGIGGGVKDFKENMRDTRVLGYKDLKLTKFKKGEYENEFAWLGVDNRYFLLAFLTSEGLWDRIEMSQDKNHYPVVKYNSKALELRPEEKITHEVPFYFGPKLYYTLKSYNLKLEEAVDFGFFGILGRLALSALHHIQRVTRNYGVAIVILTIILQMFLYPLTAKSFKANLAMKKLQPQMKIIQERYKSEPKRQQAEMMNLYRSSGTNPFGGCLPMILQIPIFWALFTTLRNAYELRNAPFIFWIQDLSAPDPFYVLPILMGIGMFAQQKMMSVSADPTQAKLMYIMPIVLTFLFLKFPAGLVLYWLTNSIVTGVEQYLMLRKQTKSGNK